MPPYQREGRSKYHNPAPCEYAKQCWDRPSVGQVAHDICFERVEGVRQLAAIAEGVDILHVCGQNSGESNATAPLDVFEVRKDDVCCRLQLLGPPVIFGALGTSYYHIIVVWVEAWC